MTEWTIKGMHCHSCEGLIKDIMADHGATAVAVSAKTGKLTFEPKNKDDLVAIKKEIEKGGYVVR